jgi:tetratricopeptide (TPR) repeat protein
MRALPHLAFAAALAFVVTLVVTLVLGIVVGLFVGSGDALLWLVAHAGQIVGASFLVTLVGLPLLARPAARRAADARLDAAKVELEAAMERLRRGQLENAEALAKKVLAVAPTEAERAAPLLVLAEVAETRGDFAREDALLAEVWDTWPKLSADAKDVGRELGAKRAFALAAQGRLEDAERLLPAAAVGAPALSVELRARALVLARRAAWGELAALLGAVDIDGLADAGTRSKMLLRVLLARAHGGAGGNAYRAGAAPDETADPDVRAWVARVAGPGF